MAVFDVPITVPDENVAEVLEALRWRYGQVTDEQSGEPRDLTPAECREILKNEVISGLKRDVRNYRKMLKDMETAQEMAVAVDPAIV